MSKAIVIRPTQPDEVSVVHELVQTIVDETFADLFTTPHVPIGEADWLTAWVAVAVDEIVGVTMTRDDWVSDLWVRRDRRRQGIGTRLLAHAEREIGSRGHDTLRLRVVKSNISAVQFYESHDWSIHREFPHEKYGHAMYEMIKRALSR
jgi:GNAT superfamily N-acetyltransferase